MKGLNILFVVQWKPANTITSDNNVVLTGGRERGRWVVERERELLYWDELGGGWWGGIEDYCTINNGFVNPCSRPGLRVNCYLFLDLQPFVEEFSSCIVYCSAFLSLLSLSCVL